MDRAKLDRWGVLPIWYDNDDGTHFGAVEVMRNLLARVHPGFEAVRERRESKSLGLVAWTSPTSDDALVVDSYGNVVAMPKSGVALDLRSQTGLHHALDYVKERLGAEDVWVSMRAERWYVTAALAGVHYDVCDGASKELAVRDAVWMIPPELPDSPAAFSYVRGRSGTVVRVTNDGVEGTYSFLMPAHSPSAVLPLGAMSEEECELVLERFADARNDVLKETAELSEE